MSRSRVEKVHCPNCDAENHILIWESLNTKLNPKETKQLLDGTFFVFECNQCNYKTLMDYAILYHDMENMCMIYYVGDYQIDKTKGIFEYAKKIGDPEYNKCYRHRIQAIRNAILFKKILKWEDTMFIDEDLSHVVVLASPPLNGYTPDNIRELLEADPRDACIASVTAAVNNQVGWLGHQCDDPENDEQTNKRFSSEFDAWYVLYKELVDRIIHRLMEQNKNEGTNYPVTGEGMHYIIEPFMKQNGYRDGAGWWVKNKD